MVNTLRILPPAAALPAVLALLCACPGNNAAGEGTSAPKSGDDTRAPQADAQPGDQPRVELTTAGRPKVSVRVEVARTTEEVRRGLMFRMQLDDDAGMLFLFDHPQQLSFWMRNTLIPLDMIFIEPTMTVLGVVENAQPRTDTARSVPGQSQYVLEVNAGWSRRHGVTKGTKVQFEGVATTAPEGTPP